jgi:hypothetical protein
MTKPKRTASPFKIVSGTNDPVFRAIGAHHRAARIFIAALLAESESSEGFSEATAAPRNAMFAAADALVTTKPETMAGATGRWVTMMALLPCTLTQIKPTSGVRLCWRRKRSP